MALNTPHAPAIAAAEAPSSATGAQIAAALREAGIAALLTLGLSIPILAFKTEQNQANALYLQPRWGVVAVACALIFALRCVL